MLGITVLRKIIFMKREKKKKKEICQTNEVRSVFLNFELH